MADIARQGARITGARCVTACPGESVAGTDDLPGSCMRLVYPHPCWPDPAPGPGRSSAPHSGFYQVATVRPWLVGTCGMCWTP